MRRILLLAGEESGVHYAKAIAQRVRELAPETEIRTYRDYGFETSDLAVMGIGQVLRRLFYFLRVKRTMKRAIDTWRPDVVCTVDYPGMNLALAAHAKRRGIRTVHVVCPQVWAWKRGRIPKIERTLDVLCCFLPFEPALFRPGFATFVGHPLAEEFAASGPRPATDEQTDAASPLLAVLPGSRLGEIEMILPTLLEAVRRLRMRLPRLRVEIPAANARAAEAIRLQIGKSGLKDISLTEGGARSLLARADAAVVASGTATLEAALAGCPTVLVYRVGWMFAAIARRVIRGVKHLGLANVIAEKANLPCPMVELLQENLTTDAVELACLPLLCDTEARANARSALARTMRLLRSDGDAMTKISRFLI